MATNPYQLQPEVPNKVDVSAPNDVAINMGWMRIEKKKSDTAKTMINMWVNLIFCFLRSMTIIARKFAKMEMPTEKIS